MQTKNPGGISRGRISAWRAWSTGREKLLAWTAHRLARNAGQIGPVYFRMRGQKAGANFRERIFACEITEQFAELWHDFDCDDS